MRQNPELRIDIEATEHSYAIFHPQQMTETLSENHHLNPELRRILTAALYCYSWKRTEFMWNDYYPSQPPLYLLNIDEHIQNLTGTLIPTLENFGLMQLLVEQTLNEIYEFCQESKLLKTDTANNVSKQITSALDPVQSGYKPFASEKGETSYSEFTHDLMWFDYFCHTPLHKAPIQVRMHCELALKHIVGMRILNEMQTTNQPIKKEDLLKTLRFYSPMPGDSDDEIMNAFQTAIIMEMASLPETLGDHYDIRFWVSRAEDYEEELLQVRLSADAKDYYDEMWDRCMGYDLDDDGEA